MSTDPTCPHCQTLLSEHEANRCLNAWAAECAGWRFVALGCSTSIVSNRQQWRGEPLRGRGLVPIPRYSADIAAAMGLVSPNRHFRLTQINDAFNTGEPWQVELAPQIVQCAPTPAHAITKAYIAAKQEKDDG